MGKFTKPDFLFSVLTTAICAIAGGTIWNVIQDQISRGVIESDAWVITFIVLCFTSIVLMIRYVVHQVDDLHRKNRIKIQYYSSSDLRGADRIYHEPRNLIEKIPEDGTSKIIAVNSFVEIFQESDDPEAERSRSAYFRAIEKKIGKIDYHRILQLNYSTYQPTQNINQTGDGVITNIIAKNYKEHFTKMIELRDSGKSKREI